MGFYRNNIRFRRLCAHLMARPMNELKDGFVHGSQFTQAFADNQKCRIFPPEGGCLTLRVDGTWSYQVDIESDIR